MKTITLAFLVLVLAFTACTQGDNLPAPELDAGPVAPDHRLVGFDAIKVSIAMECAYAQRCPDPTNPPILTLDECITQNYAAFSAHFPDPTTAPITEHAMDEVVACNARLFAARVCDDQPSRRCYPNFEE